METITEGGTTFHAEGVPIEDFFELGDILGTGAFSEVRLGTSKETGERYAVKIMKKPAAYDKRKQHIIDTEIEILKRVKHPNVVSLHDVFIANEHYYLVLQLITGGELFDKIVELVCYSEAEASKVVEQIIKGVQVLHKVDVVHRDLKPENLLLSTNDFDADVVITDFGLSAVLDDTKLVFDCVGTPSYIAPEVLVSLDYNCGYSKEVDMWGVGVIMYILLCGFPPFYGETEDDVYDKIEACDFTFPSPYWDEISDDAKDLIEALLHPDPAKRITPEDALQHTWIAGENATTHMQATQKNIAVFNAKKKFQGAIKAMMAIRNFKRNSMMVKDDKAMKVLQAAMQAKEELIRRESTQDFIRGSRP